MQTIKVMNGNHEMGMAWESFGFVQLSLHVDVDSTRFVTSLQQIC